MLSSLDDTMQKNYDINWLFPKILIIKDSCNLIGWDKTAHTPLKLIVSNAASPWWLSSCKKSKVYIDSFQR